MHVTHASFGDPIDRCAAGVSLAPMFYDADQDHALSVSLVDPREVNSALRAEWRALSDSVGTPNPYFAPWFLESAIRHLDPSREVRLVLLRRGIDGLLVALAPLIFHKGYAKLPIKHASVWIHRHCYNGAPLIHDGFEVDAYRALFEWIDTRPQGASFLRFPMLPFDHSAEGVMEEACDLTDRGFRVQSYHERAILTSDNEFDTVMSAAMSGKKRKELRRQERRFGELGEANFSSTRFSGAEREGEVRKLVTQFLNLENAGWKQADPEGFPLAQSVAESRFFREAMAEGASAGAIDCLSMTLDGNPKAMLFTLRSGKHHAAFKTSYDESLAAYSPGVRTLIEATRLTLEGDAECLDSCAREGHPVVDGLWSERLPIAQINVSAIGVVEKTLLGTAATLEALKERASKRLNPR